MAFITSGTNSNLESVQDVVGTMLTDSASVDFTYDDGAGTFTASVISGGVDHGGLAGLADDDHTQYFKVTGRANESLTLSGTGIILNTLGTVSLPAYSFAGDTNTGMYSTAANTIDFATDGVRRWTIDSSGNLTNNASDTFLSFGNSNSILETADNVGLRFLAGNTNTFNIRNRGVFWSFGLVNNQGDAGTPFSNNDVLCHIGRDTTDGSVRRPYTISTWAKLQVGSSDGNIGGMLAVQVNPFVINQSTYDTTANASTTVVVNETAFASIGTGITAAWINVGDYIKLTGLATVGRVTATSGTTLTVDTAMGDGTLRTVEIQSPMASMRTEDGVEQILFDCDGKSYFNQEISTQQDIKINQNGDPGAQTNSIAIGAKDATAGSLRTMHLRTEQAVATDAAVVATHSLSVWINNVEYKIMLVAV